MRGTVSPYVIRMISLMANHCPLDRKERYVPTAFRTTGSGDLHRPRMRASLAALIVGGALASLVSATNLAVAQVAASPADYTPGTALAYLELELDQNSNQVSLSGELLGRANLDSLLSESDMADLEEGVQGLSILAEGDAALVLTEFPEEVADGLETVTEDAANVAEDPEAALMGDIPAGWAAIVHPEDAPSSYDLYSQILLGDSDASDTQDTEYEGYTITSVVAEDEFSTPLAISQVDEVIVIATTADDIEPIIDTVNGTTDSLAETDAFAAVRGELTDEALAIGYINGPEILSSIEEMSPEALEAAPDELVSMVSTYQAFAFWADDPGFRLDMVSMPAEGESLPEMPAYDPSFASNVPGSSLVFAGSADLGANPGVQALALIMAQGIAGEETGAMFATPVGDPEAYADEVFAEAEATLGFNLKTDLVDRFVGEWAVAGEVGELDLSSAVPDFQAVFVTELDDEAPVSDVARDITNILASQEGEDYTLSSRTVDGADVTVIEVPDDLVTIEFGVVDGKLLIGVNEGIDSFLGEQSAPLADDENFASTFDALPADDLTSLQYLNVQAALPIIETFATAGSSSTEDADPSCAEYTTQQDAQAAYDEDTYENYLLDLDFDGEACEDFFAAGAAEASPVAVADLGILSIGSVTTHNGETMTTNTLIHIAD